MQKKYFALVNGFRNLFSLYANMSGHQYYDLSRFKESISEDIDKNTICYIVSDSFDNKIGMTGNYIYTQGKLFANTKNTTAQYVNINLLNTIENDFVMFAIGEIIPGELPWDITYHMTVNVDNDNISDGEYDVHISGIGHKVISCYSYNISSNNTESMITEIYPIKYHVIAHNDSKLYLGFSLCDVVSNAGNDGAFRSTYISIINNNHCGFEHLSNDNIVMLNIHEDDQYNYELIDATINGLMDPFNNTNVKISSVKLQGAEDDTSYKMSKLLYAFTNKNEIVPIVSLNSPIITSALLSKDDSEDSLCRVYASKPLDYTRGIYYGLSTEKNNATKVFEGDLYSMYNGVRLSYIDNTSKYIEPLTINPSKPVFIIGYLSGRMFVVKPVEVLDESNEIYEKAWTQDPYMDYLNNPTFYEHDNEDLRSSLVFWYVGLPNKNNEKSNNIVGEITLEDNNPLYEYDYEHKCWKGYESPQGTISTPTFFGETTTISVSGYVSGTNSSSSVSIVPITTTISHIQSNGTLPSFTYVDSTENIDLDKGSLPVTVDVSVWTGYTSATAAAQEFTGGYVTFTGSYTPSGTISTPEFMNV